MISKRTLILILLVLVAVAAFCAPALSRASELQNETTFGALDINGATVKVDIASHVGKPVVLHFWSTNDLIAAISQLHEVREFAQNNPKVHVILVHHYGNRKEAMILMDAVNKVKPDNKELLIDIDNKVAALYDLPAVFLTATYFIDCKGRVQAVRMGVLDWDMPALKGIIKDLFN